MSKPIRVLLVAFTIGAVASVATAAKAPIDLASSTWDTSGRAKFKVQKAGKVDGPLDVIVFFGDSVFPDLASDEVQMTLDDGVLSLDVSGTWSEKKAGQGKPILDMSEQSLEDALLALVEQEVGPLPPDALVVDKFKVKVKARNKKGTETMTIKFKAKGVLTNGIDSLKCGFSYSGAGERVVNG